MSTSTPFFTLKDRVLLITGASRGIGRAIALRAAREGARIGILAKTQTPHPHLPGTIETVAREVRELGAQALPIATDIRDADAVEAAVSRVVSEWGRLDILVNNASAIALGGLAEIPVKKLDLLWSVNARGTYLCTRAALPHLRKAENPHVLVLAPPPSLDPHWFSGHLAYTLTKMGMSFCVLGLSQELAREGIAVNALWPKTIIATQALTQLGGPIRPENCRKPEIVADAAVEILKRPAQTTTGQFFIDETVLEEAGITDFARYAVSPGAPLLPDLFLPEFLRQFDRKTESG
jgi:citronellol/citronellal dehydrogenase